MKRRSLSDKRPEDVIHIQVILSDGYIDFSIRRSEERAVEREINFSFGQFHKKIFFLSFPFYLIFTKFLNSYIGLFINDS